MTSGSLFGIGSSGLETFKKALDVSAQNIVNNSTPGYSRQVAEIGTNFYQAEVGQVLGTGVQLQAVVRIFDRFLTEKARSYASEHEQYVAYRDVAEDVDNFLSNLSTNVSTGLQNFFNALQALEAHPGDIAARNILLQDSKLLVQRFNSTASKLDDERERTNQSITQQVNRVNAISTQLASLNQNIIFAQASNSNNSPNSLLDQRESLLRELATMVDVRVNSREDGSYDVILSNGAGLVLGNQALAIAADTSPADPALVAVGQQVGSTFQAFEQTNLGGSLGGLLSVREEVILPALSQIGLIASALVQSVNSQHRLGVDLYGDLGGDFFSDINNLSAQLSRCIAHESNTGTGAFTVNIQPTPAFNQEQYSVFGNATVPVAVTPGLTAMGAGELRINGVSIGASTADGVSSVDADASAIAWANAINSQIGQTGVTATVDPNVWNLGGFTPGAAALSGTDLQINGVNVEPVANTADSLIERINALYSSTGVLAGLHPNGDLVLHAPDGRNIQVTTDGSAPAGANFAYFSLTAAADWVKNSSIHLESRSPVEVSGSYPARAGLLTGSYPSNPGRLTGSDYRLYFDGTAYELTRLSDNRVVAYQTSNTFSVDGLAISLNTGAVLSGDTFLITPTRNAASLLTAAITDPSKLAMGSPVQVTSSLDNKGTGMVQLDRVLDTSGLPATTAHVYGNAFSNAGNRTLSPPLEIRFFVSDGRAVYGIFDVTNGSTDAVQIGPNYGYTPGQKNTIFPASGVVNTAPPGTLPTYAYDPGYRLSFTGIPEPGDVFVVQYNADASGDPRNAGALASLQTTDFVGTSRATLQSTYGGLLATVGTYTQGSQVGEEATGVLLTQAQDRIASISGVNLDEECANLILYQEAYQASAQIISTATRIFDALLDIFR